MIFKELLSEKKDGFNRAVYECEYCGWHDIDYHYDDNAFIEEALERATAEQKFLNTIIDRCRLN